MEIMPEKVESQERSADPVGSLQSGHRLGPPGFAILLVIFGVFLTFAPSLQYPFVYDDNEQIVHNYRIEAWSYVPSYFTQHMWAHMPVKYVSYYRPVDLLWWRINNALFQFHPAMWHLGSLSLHLVFVALIYQFGKKLRLDCFTASIIALIFGLHPVHIESVAWISGDGDLLLSIFLLASLLAYIEASEQKLRRFQVLSLALYALALLTKEPAVVWPAVLLGYILLIQRHDWNVGPNWKVLAKHTALQAIPFAAVSLAYLGIRTAVLGRVAHPGNPQPLLWSLLSIPRATLFYLRELVWPFGLSPAYSFEFTKTLGLSFLFSVLTLIVIAVFLVFILRRLKSRMIDPNQFRVGVFACVWFVVGIAIPLDLRLTQPGFEVQDRYLYLPSVGFAILLALIIRSLGGNRKIGTVPPGQLAVTAVLIAGMVYGVFTQLPMWSDEKKLFARGLELSPDNYTMNLNMGLALSNARQPTAAIPVLQKALAMNPSDWRLNLHLGWCYWDIGNLQNAEFYLSRAAQQMPRPEILQQVQQLRAQLPPK